MPAQNTTSEPPGGQAGVQHGHTSPASGLIENLFTLRDEEKVHHYLLQHPSLLPLLPELLRKARSFFSQGVEVALELCDGRLCALVCTTQDPDSALEALERMDAEWWLDAMGEGENALTLDVEYSPYWIPHP